MVSKQRLIGYAVVWGVVSHNVGDDGLRHMYRRGCFATVSRIASGIVEPKIPGACAVYINHAPPVDPIAWYPSHYKQPGMLAMREDDYGLGLRYSPVANKRNTSVHV